MHIEQPERSRCVSQLRRILTFRNCIIPLQAQQAIHHSLPQPPSFPVQSSLAPPTHHRQQKPSYPISPRRTSRPRTSTPDHQQHCTQFHQAGSHTLQLHWTHFNFHGLSPPPSLGSLQRSNHSHLSQVAPASRHAYTELLGHQHKISNGRRAAPLSGQAPASSHHSSRSGDPPTPQTWTALDEYFRAIPDHIYLQQCPPLQTSHHHPTRHHQSTGQALSAPFTPCTRDHSRQKKGPNAQSHSHSSHPRHSV